MIQFKAEAQETMSVGRWVSPTSGSLVSTVTGHVDERSVIELRDSELENGPN